MINRYGPWMDTNWIVPLSAERTLTVFDYYFDASCTLPSLDFRERSLQASDVVQQEHVLICESVQRGLKSGAYSQGRYAMRELAEHHFHRLWWAEVNQVPT